MKHTMKAMPVSRAVLRGIAIDLRRLCRINMPYFPVDYVLELVPEIIPGYKVVIETIEKMGNNHGLTLYAEKIIKIREDVYEGACEGKGRDRMTCAHEIAHAILHTNTLISARDYGKLERYEDPEWQAKALAGHILIPDAIARQHTAEEVVGICGVSSDAAQFAVSLVPRHQQIRRG
ncbi:MAG: ImmA/IrrE family metallo-endopeptidase [bacterium]|nr:ImmA/IrrE family metallo-endopeptidase [bacterium]